MKQVYGTQGGGLAEKSASGKLFFVEPPGWGNYKVGDEVPAEWGTTGPFDQENNLEQVPEEPKKFKLFGLGDPNLN
jgi:hypothetical protein